MEIKIVPLNLVKTFIETHHYSKSVNGVKNKFIFAAYEDGEIVGCVLYGSLSTTAWKKYSDSESKVIELRRMVSISKDKNFLSKFVSKTIKHLMKETDIELIISYADPEYGHVGYIYQALNFEYHGETNKDIVLITPDGKKYHSRSLRVKYKGRLKPFAEKLNKMKQEGLLVEKQISGKHIYLYPLRRIPIRTKYPKKGNE